MRSLRLKILIFINLICLGATGQRYDFVKVLPGTGIVFNNDSILLGSTSIKRVCRIFNVKDNPNKFQMTMWDGEDEKSELSGIDFSKDIIYKSITFEFSDKVDRNNLKLTSIKLKADKSLKIYTDNGLIIGMTNPDIKELFPIFKKPDYISEDKLKYGLYTYGIHLQLDKLPNDDLMLTEILINRMTK